MKLKELNNKVICTILWFMCVIGTWIIICGLYEDIIIITINVVVIVIVYMCGLYAIAKNVK